MKVRILLLVLALNFATLAAKSEITDLILTRSTGDVIDASNFEDRKIEITFDAKALDFFGNEIESTFEWDFDNDGNTDAAGAQVTNQFNFESPFEAFSFGYPVKVTATEVADPSQTKTKSIFIKPTRSSAQAFIIEPGSFGNLFSEFVDGEDKLKFKIKYVSRNGETSSSILKVRLVAKVESEYKKFVKIKGKPKIKFGTVKSQEVVIDKNKIRSQFPELSSIEIPIHVLDSLSGFTARHLIHVSLVSGFASFIVDEKIVHIVEFESSSN